MNEMIEDFERWYNEEPMFDGIQNGSLIHRVAWKAWQAAASHNDVARELSALRRDLESIRSEKRGVVSCTINYRSVG